MVIKSSNKIWRISNLFLIVLLIKVGITFAGEVYVPEPIVFVHGLNSNETAWDYTKNALKKYFIDEITGLPKYDYPDTSQKWYYPKCDYGSMNTGDIPTIAQSKLTGSVYAGLGALNGIPNCITKKVNIVSHSMGGLVTRSLLKQSDLQNSINKVVFVGTPHTGSPYASAVWILNRVAKDKLPDLIKENKSYFSKSIFSSLGFGVNNTMVFKDLGDKLSSRYYDISFALSAAKAKGFDPDSYAIDELRLNQDVSYHSVVSGVAGSRIKSVEIDETYNGNDVFLSPTRNNLATPKVYKTIAGQNTSNIFFWGLGKILGFGSAFNFPAGETLDNVSKDGGDGIVSLNSQWNLGNTDAVISGITHLDEPRQYLAILNAIDDAPQIEHAYAVPCDWTEWGPINYYLVIKAKEYLLADLEIEYINVCGNPVNLSEFNDGNGHYKPYVKFGKNFLKEREDANIKDQNGSIIKLKPGEFYVRISLLVTQQGSYPPTSYGLIYDVDVKLKNPAGKTKEETILISRPKGGCGFSRYLIDIPPYDPKHDYPHTSNLIEFYAADGYTSDLHVEMGLCYYSSYIPFILLSQKDIKLWFNGDYYQAGLQDYVPTSWSGSDGHGGIVAENQDYRTKITLIPKSLYSKRKGDNFVLTIPVYQWGVIIRTDPTFIQQHRSYGYLAKFNKVKRFEQYGYNIKTHKLNSNQELADIVVESDKHLIAYEFLLPSYLSKEYSLRLSNINGIVNESIEDAIDQIVKIEDNYFIEKERLINKLKAKISNENYLQILKENKAAAEAISQLEAKNSQMINQKVSQAINKLTGNKDACVKFIINNTNDSIQALIKTAYPSATASAALVK